jgi:hypothetical protein
MEWTVEAENQGGGLRESHCRIHQSEMELIWGIYTYSQPFLMTFWWEHSNLAKQLSGFHPLPNEAIGT